MDLARAIRVTEIINDYYNILRCIASTRVSPSAEEYHEYGYVVLRECAMEAEALLLQPFQVQNDVRRDEEQDKAHLRR